MPRVEIDLPDPVFKYLELRFAIDDMRPKEGVECFLTELAMAKIEKRPVRVEGKTRPVEIAD